MDRDMMAKAEAKAEVEARENVVIKKGPTKRS